jgi:IBR domain, a half RING-finger domain
MGKLSSLKKRIQHKLNGRKKGLEKLELGAEALPTRECGVCFELAGCTKTPSCDHPICIPCYNNYIVTTRLGRLPAPCPTADCQAVFEFGKAGNVLNAEAFAKVEDAFVEQQIFQGNGMYCPHSDCSKALLWSQGDVPEPEGLGIRRPCDHCGRVLCLSCKSFAHTNLRHRPRH